MTDAPLFRPDPRTTTTLRDIIAPLFRKRRIIMLVFGGVFAGGLLFASFWARRYYQANMQVIVEQSRATPTLTALQNAAVMDRVITPDEISSEMALLSAHDVMLNVVDKCRLASHTSLGDIFLPGDPRLRLAAKREKAAVALAKALTIEADKTSDIIDVSYGTTAGRDTAYCVLQSLSGLYIQKHLRVDRPPNSYGFFDQQTELYRKKLADSEARLTNFSRTENIAAPDVVRQSLAQQLATFLASDYETQEAIAADRRRITELRSQMMKTPARSSSQETVAPAAALLQQLQISLMDAESKRSELVMRYSEQYPLVVEADREINNIQKAINATKADHYTTITTDRDETFETLRQEISKAEADLAGHVATAVASAASIRDIHAQLVRLDGLTIQQAALARQAKADETTYLLYLDKREQQRVADALDQRQIANVAIAVPPVVPTLPEYSPLMVSFVGFILATVVGIAAGFTADYLDPTFRVPSEISGLLGIPVLASLPMESHTIPRIK